MLEAEHGQNTEIYGTQESESLFRELRMGWIHGCLLPTSVDTFDIRKRFIFMKSTNHEWWLKTVKTSIFLILPRIECWIDISQYCTAFSVRTQLQTDRFCAINHFSSLAWFGVRQVITILERTCMQPALKWFRAELNREWSQSANRGCIYVFTCLHFTTYTICIICEIGRASCRERV